jgi:F-type H+-transporting ATPase subunit gamma
MATPESLSRQLQVGEELLSVVGTMKGLAAVSIHEFEEAVEPSASTRSRSSWACRSCSRCRPESIPGDARVAGRVAGIVVGTDQGLCGPINREIARRLVDGSRSTTWNPMSAWSCPWVREPAGN